MKITKKEKELIQKIYTKYRAAFPREESLRRTSKDTGKGRTTCYDHTVEVERPMAPKPPLNFKPEYTKTYIFTGWDIRVGTDKKFVKTLKSMAEHYNAELFLVPCQESDIDYIPTKLKNVFTILTEDIKLNSNLQFKYVESNALLQSPVSGQQGIYTGVTTILPGLVKELKTETSQYYVKQVMSVGSVGYLTADIEDYTEQESDGFIKRWKSTVIRRNNKSTAIAKSYVMPSALIVEVQDEKTFLTRFVSSNGNGIVYDLNKKFTLNDVKYCRPSALICGDTHAIVADREAVDSTLEMIKTLQPKEVVLNDFWDGMSVNRHVIDDPVKFKDAPSLEEEASITKSLLKEFTDISEKVIYLCSNHDNFLSTFLSGPAYMWRLNGNYANACELQAYRMRTSKHPIIKLLDLDSIPNLKFSREEDKHLVGNVVVQHGHESYMRTGFNAMARIYNRYVCGHSHTPTVWRNSMMVGLTANLVQDYAAAGPSNWLHANGLIHEDNNVQLLPIIKGTWKK